jgi:hypothetical protein
MYIRIEIGVSFLNVGSEEQPTIQSHEFLRDNMLSFLNMCIRFFNHTMTFRKHWRFLPRSPSLPLPVDCSLAAGVSDDVQRAFSSIPAQVSPPRCLAILTWTRMSRAPQYWIRPGDNAGVAAPSPWSVHVGYSWLAPAKSSLIVCFTDFD